MDGLVKGIIAVRLNINALQHVAKHMKKGFIMRGIWSAVVSEKRDHVISGDSVSQSVISRSRPARAPLHQVIASSMNGFASTCDPIVPASYP